MKNKHLRLKVRLNCFIQKKLYCYERELQSYSEWHRSTTTNDPGERKSELQHREME